MFSSIKKRIKFFEQNSKNKNANAGTGKECKCECHNKYFGAFENQKNIVIPK